MAKLTGRLAEIQFSEPITIFGLNREGIKGEFFKILNDEFFKKCTSLNMNLSLEVPEVNHLVNICSGAGLVSQFLSEIIKDVIQEKTGKRPDQQFCISDFVLKIRA